MPDWTDTLTNRRAGAVAGFVGKDTALGPTIPAATPEALTAGPLANRPDANVYGRGFWLGDDGTLYHSDAAGWSTVSRNSLAPAELAAGGAGLRRIFGDDFERPDETVANSVTDGRVSPAGHRWTSTGAATVASKPKIRNRRLIWEPSDIGGASPMQLATKLPVIPTRLVSRYVFQPGTTSSQDHPVGACPIGFSDRSIQCGASPTGWKIFKTLTDGGGGTTITELASGTWTDARGKAAPLTQDGRTVYETIIDWDPSRPGIVVRWGEGGQVVTSLSGIAELRDYWDKVAIWQQRRIFATDGTVEYDLVEAYAPDLPATGLAAELVLPGTAGVDLVCQKPDDWVMGNLDLKVLLTPAVDFAPQFGLISMWGDKLSWSFATSTAGSNKLVFYLSVDGVANIPATASSVTIPANVNGVRCTYNATTHDVVYYTSIDDGANWVQLGVTRNIATGGVPFQPDPNTVPIQIGGRGTSGAFPYNGRIRYAEIGDGANVIASVDCRSMWNGPVWRGPQKHLWSMRGSGHTWKLAASAQL